MRRVRQKLLLLQPACLHMLLLCNGGKSMARQFKSGFVVYWRQSRMRALGVALFVVGSSAGSLAAQAISGSISGVITDPSSVAVEGAMVTATTNPSTGTHRAVSDKDGKYTLSGLLPGSYNLQATAAAMQTFDQKGLVVQAGQALRLDVRMDFNTQLGTL